MKRFPTGIRKRITEINSMIDRVNELDEIPCTTNPRQRKPKIF
jgi:hypothetical protein